jgi:hypothetical protein
MELECEALLHRAAKLQAARGAPTCHRNAARRLRSVPAHAKQIEARTRPHMHCTSYDMSTWAHNARDEGPRRHNGVEPKCGFLQQRGFDDSAALADVQRAAADFKHSAGYFAAEADA